MKQTGSCQNDWVVVMLMKVSAMKMIVFDENND
jgi:hypothetical protein